MSRVGPAVMILLVVLGLVAVSAGGAAMAAPSNPPRLAQVEICSPHSSCSAATPVLAFPHCDVVVGTAPGLTCDTNTTWG